MSGEVNQPQKKEENYAEEEFDKIMFGEKNKANFGEIEKKLRASCDNEFL